MYSLWKVGDYAYHSNYSGDSTLHSSSYWLDFYPTRPDFEARIHVIGYTTVETLAKRSNTQNHALR